MPRAMLGVRCWGLPEKGLGFWGAREPAPAMSGEILLVEQGAQRWGPAKTATLVSRRQAIMPLAAKGAREVMVENSRVSQPLAMWAPRCWEKVTGESSHRAVRLPAANEEPVQPATVEEIPLAASEDQCPGPRAKAKAGPRGQVLRLLEPEVKGPMGSTPEVLSAELATPR